MFLVVIDRRSSFSHSTRVDVQRRSLLLRLEELLPTQLAGLYRQGQTLFPGYDPGCSSLQICDMGKRPEIRDALFAYREHPRVREQSSVYTLRADTEKTRGETGMRGFWLALLSVIAVHPANADWLARAWPENTVPKNGNPAITFNATGTVTLVLPEAVLGEAQAAGVSTEHAVGAFLDRYAPRTCSTLLDMTVPHTNLRVDLLIERPVAPDAIDEVTQEDAANTLNHALKGQTRGSLPRIERAFIVDQKPLSLSIDYVPEKKVHCAEPPKALF
jgi:hypothetical protein